jgi:hypothetical protein
MSTVKPVWRAVIDSVVSPYRSSVCVELRCLNDNMLRDIGLTLGGERYKSVLPFWIP